MLAKMKESNSDDNDGNMQKDVVGGDGVNNYFESFGDWSLWSDSVQRDTTSQNLPVPENHYVSTCFYSFTCLCFTLTIYCIALVAQLVERLPRVQSVVGPKASPCPWKSFPWHLCVVWFTYALRPP